MLKDLQKRCLDFCLEKGIPSEPTKEIIWQKLALIGSEVGEATNAYRKGRIGYGKDEMFRELADIIVRTLHLAEMMGADMDNAVESCLDKSRDFNLKEKCPNEIFED